MKQERYTGCRVWEYRLPDGTLGYVEIGVCESRREDAGMARYHLRKKLGVKRLPPGTRVRAWTDRSF